MSHDQQAYQRGVSASLLGGAVQLVVAAVLLLLTWWLDSAVLRAAVWHAFGGVGVWVVLAIVYQQHKLERIEALETEQLQQRHGADSSIFQTSADDLSVARRRLERMVRWALPAFSLATAGYLVGVGAWLISRNVGLLAAKPLASDVVDVDPLQLQIVGEQGLAEPGFVLAFLVGIAFLSFLVSRYIAGMARMAAWSLLRGGAGYLMGASLVAALVATGYGLLYAEVGGLLKYLTIVVPGFMIVVGSEMVLNQLLSLYRPRKAGEMPRPAFDSRLLSFLTSPESIARSINEAINYQFGFEITQSWFWQLFSRSLGWLVLLGLAALVGLSSFVVVESHERALVARFGRLVGEPIGPGLHFKLPWPVDSVHRYDVTVVRQFNAGSGVDLTEDVPILWTNEHYATEPLHLIVAPPVDPPAERERGPVEPALQGAAPDAPPASAGRAPSVSLVNAEVMVQWRVSDVLAYATSSADPDQRLRDIADLVVGRYLLRRDIDAWIGPARRQASADLRRRLQAEVDRAGLGVQIVATPVASIHPPQPVAEAFHATVIAAQQRQVLIEQARRDAIQQLVEVAGSVEQARQIVDEIEQRNRLKQAGADPARIDEQGLHIERLVRDAGGIASERIAAARAQRWSIENAERGQAILFEQDRLAYQAAPSYYKVRHYLEALAEGFRDSRKYLILADTDDLTVRTDLKEFESGFGQIDLSANE